MDRNYYRFLCDKNEKNQEFFFLFLFVYVYYWVSIVYIIPVLVFRPTCCKFLWCKRSFLLQLFIPALLPSYFQYPSSKTRSRTIVPKSYTKFPRHYQHQWLQCQKIIINIKIEKYDIKNYNIKSPIRKIQTCQNLNSETYKIFPAIFNPPGWPWTKIWFFYRNIVDSSVKEKKRKFIALQDWFFLSRCRKELRIQ